MFYGTTQFNNITDYNKYYFDSDTIISGNKYYKLYRDQIDSIFDIATHLFIDTNYYNHIYLAAIREDSLKQFFVYFPGQTSENLLHNFNLAVGDSLPDMISSMGCNVPPNVVTFIDTVYFGMQPLKKFHFANLINRVYYEGIGASTGLLWQGAMCIGYCTGSCLVAYKRGLDSLYINCGVGATDLSENFIINDINIFPNPVSDFFIIEKNNAAPLTFQFYNSMGDEVIHLNLSTKENSIVVNTDCLANGIYFWNLTNEKQIIQHGKLVIMKK